MSDSDGDFSDELLELAGAGEKKHKRSQQRSAKRRKAKYDLSFSIALHLWLTTLFHCSARIRLHQRMSLRARMTS
jgi:hypothetical protein